MRKDKSVMLYTYPFSTVSDTEMEFSSSEEPFGLGKKWKIIVLTNDTLKLERRPENPGWGEALYLQKTFVAMH
ncbi:hypothetical protein HHL16_10670 [Pseudoflavitalea sp. G-6-1-2]|uniref:hypothetical protein n=1 Tax=Pseudoflavitalea sp. G-6-1-2 TaxID=2728841 RepID=UPI00146D883D|nr:hypothetical protein [Pseudoflavitalea sp. G-6-1-2]NML21339.1 hypothetical protein [Pseudoflavitalea sp. G-6-1-2]